jgi:hypothetical protein
MGTLACAAAPDGGAGRGGRGAAGAAQLLLCACGGWVGGGGGVNRVTSTACCARALYWLYCTDRAERGHVGGRRRSRPRRAKPRPPSPGGRGRRAAASSLCSRSSGAIDGPADMILLELTCLSRAWSRCDTWVRGVRRHSFFQHSCPHVCWHHIGNLEWGLPTARFGSAFRFQFCCVAAASHLPISLAQRLAQTNSRDRTGRARQAGKMALDSSLDTFD